MYCRVKHGFLQTVGLGFVISFCLHWESNCYNLCHSTAVKHLAPLYLSMKIAFKGMGTMKEDTWRLTGSFRNCKVPFEICPVACLMSSSPLKALKCRQTLSQLYPFCAYKSFSFQMWKSETAALELFWVVHKDGENIDFNLGL